MSEEELVIEYIKIGVSIATPLTIVIVGYMLNRSIQTQNALEERKRSFQDHWAEDFIITAKRFNDGITNFVMIFYGYRARSMLDAELGTNVVANPQPEIVEQHLELQRCSVELNKFYPYAPENYVELKEAVAEILGEVQLWGQSNGGDHHKMFAMQNSVNAAIYKVHSELLSVQRNT